MLNELSHQAMLSGWNTLNGITQHLRTYTRPDANYEKTRFKKIFTDVGDDEIVIATSHHGTFEVTSIKDIYGVWTELHKNSSEEVYFYRMSRKSWNKLQDVLASKKQKN